MQKFHFSLYLGQSSPKVNVSKKFLSYCSRCSFCSYFGKKGQKGVFCVFCLENFFAGLSWKWSSKTIIMILIFLFQISCLEKFKVLDARDQTDWRISENRLIWKKVEVRNKIGRHNPKFLKIINQEYIQKTDTVKFVLYIWPCKQRVIWNYCCLPMFTASVFQCNIFHESLWLAFFWFF